MTVEFSQEQLKQKGNEIDDFDDSVKTLIDSADPSYNASSKNSFKKSVDVNKALCDEGATHT